MNNNILEVENLSKNINNFMLDNINFAIPKGSIMGLIGENGSGKTTTIKTILNIMKKDEGSINIFGMDIDKDEIKIKEDIAVVFDDLNFQDNLNTNDINNILKKIYINWDDDIFFNYLKKFKISNNKIIKEFSKGMKMKLSIAIALSHKAKLLILDEPTAGLDPIVRTEILDELLNFIQNEEHGILFSTHITSDLDKIADYITLIDDGKIIFTKNTEDLSSNYGLIKCGIDDLKNIDNSYIVNYRTHKFGIEALTNNKNYIQNNHENIIVDDANIEDIMFYHIKECL